MIKGRPSAERQRCRSCARLHPAERRRAELPPPVIRRQEERASMSVARFDRPVIPLYLPFAASVGIGSVGWIADLRQSRGEWAGRADSSRSGSRSTARVLNGYPIGETAYKYRATAVH